MSLTPPTGPAAGSRRFWLVASLFALLNVGAWVGYHEYSTSRLRLLRVTRFEQVATLADAAPTLRWEFNLDVAKIEHPGTISPAVAGKWLWTDSRTLIFRPDAPLPKATRYTVTLPAERLSTPQGLRVDRAFTASFDTEPLKLIAVRQGSLSEGRALVAELEFDDVVIPAEALRHLKLTDARGKPIPCHAFGDAAGKVVRVQTDPLPEMPTEAAQATVNVELTSGLTGASGPLGLAATAERTLSIDADLRALEASAEPPGAGDAQIDIRFNNEVDIAAARQVISVEPAVAFTLSSRGEEAVSLSGPFESGKRYLVKIADRPAGGLRKAFPRADALSVFVPDRLPAVWFERADGYLGSNGNRTLLAHAVNVPGVNVTVTRLYDNNVVSWRNASGASARWDDTSELSAPIAEREITVASPKNQPKDLPLSLDDLLPADAPRDGVYRVTLASTNGETPPPASRHRYWFRQSADTASTTVTLSDVALSARESRDAVDVWAVSLSAAKPLADVRVRAFSNKNQPLGEGRTNADGLLHLANLHPATGEHVAVLVAERESAPRLAGEVQKASHNDSARDLTWLDLANSEVNLAHLDTAGKPYLRNGFEAFLYTERGVYRPGETAHLRAIVRGPDLKLSGAFPVRWQFRRPDLRDWQSQTAVLDADGTTSIDLKLPDDLPTGRWTAELELPGDKKAAATTFGTTTFNIEEFVPNRMKVKLSVADNADRVTIADAGLTAEIQADYLFRRPVTDRPATLTTRVEPATFAPKAWAGWTFGDSAGTSETLHGKREIGGRSEQPQASLDAKGHAKWMIEDDALLNPGSDDSPHARHAHGSTEKDQDYAGPWRATFYAAVIETGGRAVSASRTIEVDKLSDYLGVRAKQSQATPGERLELELASVSPKGEATADSKDVELRLYQEIWNTSLVEEQHGYRYVSTRKLDAVGGAQTAKLENGRGACTVTPPTGGAFVAIAKDLTTGFVTSTRFYASKYGAWEDNISREDPEKLELELSPEARQPFHEALDTFTNPSAARLLAFWRGATRPARTGSTSFRPAESAQLLIRSPFAGRLLLTFETDSVLMTRVIEMPASHLSTPITLPADCRPGAFVTATVVRAIDPNAPWRTHRAFGLVRVPIDNSDRKLDVQIATPHEIRPETTLPITVRVLDAAGHPAADAAVTLAAVDEGILSLTGFATPDPFAFFTTKRAHGVSWSDIYGRLMPEVARPDRSSEIGGDKGDAPAGRHLSAVSGKRVRPVAFVTGVLHADANGIAHADFPVGAFNGALRIEAVASAATGVGSSEAPTLVRAPLLLQTSWPRFAAPGDKFVVPVTLFNNTARAGRATVAVDLLADVGPSPLRLAEGGGKRLELASPIIPAGGSATLQFEVDASQVAGVAHANVTASLEGESAHEAVELPVRPASPEISTGGYAIATPGHPATMPATVDFLQGTARVQIRGGPMPSLELPRGLDYLDHYPYGCAEQTTSECFPLIALSDIGPNIAPGLFARQHIEDRLQAGITNLIGMQCADGGLAMWPGGRPSWPWASVYSAHMLIEAEKAGHKVPTDFRDSLLAYVRNLLNQPTDEAQTVEMQAYACYVLALAGRPERATMSRLTEIIHHPRANVEGRSIDTEAQFHLAAAWLAAGRRDLATGLIPQALPLPRTKRALTGNVGSPARDRAIILSTLLDIEPDRVDLPALAQQLADAGRDGGWRSTQDAAFAVMALGKYLRHAKAPVPYDTVRLMQGPDMLNAADAGLAINFDAALASTAALRLEVDGPAGAQGHLAWLASGVPTTPPPGEDAGVRVRRRYLSSVGKPIGERVRSGDLVQVEITVDAAEPLENFVIDDLLPAGLEIENSHLETAAKHDQVAHAKDAKPQFASARTDARDDRLVLVGAFNGGGPATFTYLARAVTPGTFVIPPVRGECMYDIGIHSLNGGGTLTVEDAAPRNLAQAD